MPPVTKLQAAWKSNWDSKRWIPQRGGEGLVAERPFAHLLPPPLFPSRFLMNWLDYLNEAKAEPVGLALICKDPDKADQAKRQLYSARANAREAGDKTYDTLSISMSPHSDEILYIYHREVNPDGEGLGTRTEIGDDPAI